MHRLLCAALLCTTITPSPHAAGQDALDRVEPPTIADAPTVPFPDGAPPEPTKVIVEITVDPEGRVTNANVVEGAGAVFDDAAVAYVSALTFSPATQDGKAVAARIRFAVAFEPPPREGAPPRDAPVDQEPAPEKEPRTAPVEPSETPPVYTDESDYGATAEVETPPREPTRRQLVREEIRKIPGVSGDPVRAIEVLPGVGRTGLGNTPILRGAAPGESEVFFDGAPVPLLFHFGGFKSFVAADLVDRVEVSPSNFSARYGRVSGGVVDVRARELRSDGLHGSLELSLLDSAAFAEAPLGKSTRVAVGARRSNIDAVFDAFVPDDSARVVAAPVYWDYQAFGEQDVGTESFLTARAFGSRDSFRLFLPDDASDDPRIRGSVGGSIEFHRGRLGFRTQPAQALRLDGFVSLGTTRANIQLGPDARQRLDSLDIDGRLEARAALVPSASITVGLDTTVQRITGLYVGDQPTQSEGGNYDEPFGARRLVRVEDTFWVPSPAVYAELSVEPLPSVTLLPGMRANYFGQIDAVSIDPRLGARAAVTTSTTLKAGFGRYTQPPNYWEVLPQIGNPDLPPYHALHVSAGVEQRLGSAISVEVEGFARLVDGRPIATDGGAPPFFESEGKARVVGAELGAELRPSDDALALLSYTISTSQRRDGDDTPWRLCDCDQTHVLSVAGSYDLGAHWTAGGRFRLTSGNPRTPIIGGVYDATRDVYRPVYGAPLSERDTLFHQLDLRIEKQWVFSAWSLSAYVEVQNVMNAENQQGLGYSYDYSESEPATGLPILPNIGIRGEL